MFNTYFRLALRNLGRNRLYMLINILGVGIAIACCLSAYLLFAYYNEFDDYYRSKEVGNIVKVMHNYERLNRGPGKDLSVPMVMAPWAAKDIAGIDDYTRFCSTAGILSTGDGAFTESVRFADASFFKMFKLELISGTEKNFGDIRSVFLSEAMAIKYFGALDAVGKTISAEFNGRKYELTVGGVLKHVPLNTSFQINALMRIENFIEFYEIGAADWHHEQTATALFRLSDENHISDVSAQLKRYAALHNEGLTEGRTISFELLPFLQRVGKDEVNRTNIRLPIPATPIIIFGFLAMVILLIACFNLTNTTLALVGKRLKEIGVRKVIGSARGQIMGQFFVETAVTVVLSVAAGGIMALYLVPKFAEMWQLNYGLADLSGTNLVVALLLLIVLGSALGGVYPALFSSAFRPIELLRGRMSMRGTNPFTRTLLVLQFSLSVMVLLGGIVFVRNAGWQKTIDFGYDKHVLLTVSTSGELEYTRFRDGVVRNPTVESVAGAASHIGPYSSSQNTMIMNGETFRSRVHEVGVGYFEVVGLPLKSGRSFAEGSQTDALSAILVDENFVTNHNLVNPLDVEIISGERHYRIIGVVGNHLGGLKQQLDNEHCYVLCPPSNYNSMVVRAAGDPMKSRASLESAWKEMFPGRPFECSLQEEALYEEADGYNTNLRQIFFFLTLLGCLLSVSGLFALASLNVQRRRKEIGVRRVLGATARQLQLLLNWEYSLILAAALMIGSGFGIFLTDTLLDDLYTQHMEVGILPAVVSSAIIFFVGIVTTSSTVFLASQANPVDTLRTE